MEEGLTERQKRSLEINDRFILAFLWGVATAILAALAVHFHSSILAGVTVLAWLVTVMTIQFGNQFATATILDELQKKA